MLKNYVDYLQIINQKLKRFFNKQQEYICCTKGCAKCCKNGEYPFSEIEYRLLTLGFSKLPTEKKEQIIKNVVEIKKQKALHEEGTFTYPCPFLLDDLCSVYDYRGIICRTFGLITKFEDNTPKIPFCVHENLNYSKVYDAETKKISTELYQKSGYKEEPEAYNIDYKFLTDDDFGKSYGFEFGEKKPLIDWL